MAASRREFLKYVLATAAGAAAFPMLKDSSDAAGELTLPNVLMIVNDEERNWDMIENLVGTDLLGDGANPAPGTFRSRIPARMRIRNNGVRFSNYYTATAPCSPARGVMYTGHHAPDTQVVDNMDFEAQTSLRADVPTMADVLGAAGYYCAYKGKVHLAKDSDLVTAQNMLDLYGFHDWQGPFRLTDSEGPQSGASRDGGIASYAVDWLGTKAGRKNAQGQPWLLAVNFINPHDIMLVDIDGSGSIQMAQGQKGKGFPLANAPDRAPYHYWWNPKKPANFPGMNGYTVDASGPRAQILDEFASLLSAAMGNIPMSSSRKATITVCLDNAQPELGTHEISVPMWQAFLNYYLNCIIDNDTAMNSVLEALVTNALQDNTIVIYTADHGELGMSHMGRSRYYDEAAVEGYQKPDADTVTVMPLRQKGPFVYEENNNVPFVVANLSSNADGLASRHVPVKNVDVPALASSVDLLPTLMGWAGKDASWYTDAFSVPLDGLKMRTRLPGVSLAQVVKDPPSFTSRRWSDGTNGRNWVLFTSDSVCSTMDADFIYLAVWNRCDGRKIDTGKRGVLRGVFDGRYKYARYFSPEEYTLNGSKYAALDYPALVSLGVHGQDIQLFDHSTNRIETFNAAETLPEKVAELNQALFTAMGKELFSRVRTPDTVQEVLNGTGDTCA